MIDRTINRIVRVARAIGSLAAGVCAPVRLFKTALLIFNKARLAMRVGLISVYCKTLFIIASLLVSLSILAAPPGTIIDNTAQATFDVGTVIGATENSNTITVVTTIIRTPSTLDLLQYQPASAAINEETPAQCRNGAGGPFIASTNPSVPMAGAGVTVLDPATVLPLNIATIYNSNDPIFIRLEDGDQNIDPAVADTVIVSVSSDLGDVEDVLLTETDVNTGIFIAYIQSTVSAVSQYDCVLSVAPDASVQANYIDPADANDSSAAASLVDPFGMVFNSLTGEPVDGIAVRLINAATGQPAVPGVELFGNDGISPFPNTLVTGSTATDSGGTVYNFPAGSYRFPLILPGDYRLEIVSAQGYLSPSSVAISELQSLPNAPFALAVDASYGQDFVLPAGPPMHIDIPVDPNATELIVTKTTLNRDAAIGDFVQFRVSVENTETITTSVNAMVIDTLPVGFRYQAGSARLDGVAINDPVIGLGGRELTFSVGDIASGRLINLSYVTEVTAGTPLGDAINVARAIDALGSTSNTAQAHIQIRDELMRERNTIVGRVIAGNCPLEKPKEGRADFRMQSVRKDNQILYDVNFSVTDVNLNDYRIVIELPEGLNYIPSTALLDDYTWNEPESNGRILTFKLDKRSFDNLSRWQHSLRFRANIDKEIFGRQETRAHAQMLTSQGIEHSTPVASNVLLRQQPVYEERRFVFRPIFPTMQASLADQDQAQLDKIIEVMRDVDVVKVSISGHADIRAISGNGTPYKDNFDLSKARAKAIAPYFQTALKLTEEQVVVEAVGDKKPIASSDSEDGLALNRRVDIAVNAKVRTGEKIDEVLINDSGTQSTTITPQTERLDVTVGTDLAGVEGVRIYLEDGTYVLTDENGKYHIEGVRPGTHVVQLDHTSLPPGMRVIECEKNTRFAGVGHSRFVDLKPGTLWRVDFHIEEEPPVVSTAGMQMHTEIEAGSLSYKIDNKGGALPVSNYRVTVILPEGVQYQPGSSFIHDNRISDPQVSDNILVYRLGDQKSNWDVPLRFSATFGEELKGRLISKAAAVFNTETEKNVRIAPVETVALIDARKFTPKRYVLQPRFDTLGATLSVEDKRELDAMLPELLQSEIRRIRVVGHTDDVPISARSQKLYKDNYALSEARAATVADYLGQSLGLANHNVIAEGRGADIPVASNATSEGRAQNRRTEILIETVESEGADVSAMLRSSSDTAIAEVVGQRTQIEQSSQISIPPTTSLKIEQFDEQWLQNASPGIDWLMPAAEFTPSVRAVSVAIKHHPQDRIEGFINDEPLNPLFFFGVKANKQGTVARSYWQGIHILDGPNTLEFKVYPASGGDPVVLQRIVHFSDVPIRAELVEEFSYLVADGKTTPTLAVRFYDHWGKPVRGGVVGEFSVQPPYESKQDLESMSRDKLAAFDRDQPLFEITERGIAYIELEPTTQSGKVDLSFMLGNGNKQQVEAWLKPAARDWVIVGLGEGVIGSNDVSGDSTSALAHGFENNEHSDGRLALFAKGSVGNNWLLTTSIDSDKEESVTGNGLFQTVDPDDYFALYGDDTSQHYDAPSSDKLFLKFENDRFYTMYGDYDTGLNSTELSRYSRRVTGLKSEYSSEHFGLNLFATETSDRFVRDEIQGDGTSGLYRLRASNIILNSETIVIETRDRFHSQDILQQRTLRRHYDYNIDYLAGTVFFKQPVPSRDSQFNPVFIVIEYETKTGLSEEITAGGRGELRFADGRFKIGLSAIGDNATANESDLYGLDAELQLGDNSNLRIEIANSETDSAGTLVEGGAYLAEYEVNYESFDARVYVREQEAGFGLGQQAGSEFATRKYGFDGSYQLADSWRINSEVYHEDNLATSAKRDVAEADVSYSAGRNTFVTGLRSARDLMGSGQQNDSQLLLAGASTKLFDNKLQLRANSEYAIDSEDANSAYPTRHIIGAEYSLTSNTSVYVEEEITQGEYQDSSSTRIGLHAQPWAQASIDSSIEQQSGEYGPRTFAVMGLTQGIRLSERWSADLSFDRAETIRKPGDTPFNVNVPPQSGTFDDDFTAVSLGATYRSDYSTMVTRFEQRQADLEDKQGMLFGWHRDLREGISYGVDSQLFITESQDGSEVTDGNVRLSFAYRPTTSNWIHLNRFDYKYNERVDMHGDQVRERKLVNNWKTNYMPNRSNQLAISYGVKYVLDTFNALEYTGLTHSIGSEYRHDLSERWDIGAHVDMLYSANSNNRLYSYGVSTGFNLVKNMWISVGYNFDGFKDDDFTSADYTVDGAYVKLRFKFDQDAFGLSRK